MYANREYGVRFTSLLPLPLLCKWWRPPHCLTSSPWSFREWLGSSRTQKGSGLRPLSELYHHHHHHHPHHLYKIMVACLAYVWGYPPTKWYTKPLKNFPSIGSACVDDFCTMFWNRPRPLPHHCRFIILSTLNNICADSEQRSRDPAWTVAYRLSLVHEGMTVICIRWNVRRDPVS